MEHLLAMILTAFDPRKNPVAGLLACHASQTCKLMVQLHQPKDAIPASEEYYTIKQEDVDRETGLGPGIRAITPTGRPICVRAHVYR